MVVLVFIDIYEKIVPSFKKRKPCPVFYSRKGMQKNKTTLPEMLIGQGFVKYRPFY